MGFRIKIMNCLNHFEQAVLDKALAGRGRTLAALREQAEEVVSIKRELTDAGIYCTFTFPPDVQLISERGSFAIADVEAKVPGLERGAGFVLFISGGRINLLEGFTYGEPWPEEVRGFELRYTQEPRELALPD